MDRYDRYSRNHTYSSSRRARPDTYIDGNTVRRYEEAPYVSGRHVSLPYAPAPRHTSADVRKNRARADNISIGSIIFLVVIGALILYFCVGYLKLQTQITTLKKTVASKESQLTLLKEDNDAYYNQVTSNIDLNSIRQIAIGTLGMRYPTEEQIVTYETEGRSYVRQYQDVPDLK